MEGKQKPKAAFSRLRNSWESLIFIARTKKKTGEMERKMHMQNIKSKVMENVNQSKRTYIE